MLTVADKRADFRIIYEDKPVILFAAQQLQGYLEKITGCTVPICKDSDAAGNAIYLGSPEWTFDKAKIKAPQLKHDGFAVIADGGRAIITSNAERGVLYGVYALLERIGCRWFYPGDEGDYIPRLDSVCIDFQIIKNPDFALRNFTYDGVKGTDAWVEELTQTIDWCAKVGANAFFIHGNPYGDGINGLDRLAAEVKKRGLMLEIGGHGVHTLVDRALFEQKPELFREVAGERKSDGNFCASNPEAVQMAVDGVSRLFEKYSDYGIDVLHLWFDDVMGGSWCQCEKCKEKSAQQQQLSVVNAIARKVREISAGSKVDMLLYHDTLDMDGVDLEPEKNVYAYFAPRERCRLHSIGDESCGKNKRLYEALKRAKEKFYDTYIFEYYADMILFRQLAICSPEILAQDCRDYLAAGVDKLSCLMFGKYSWWAYPLNMYVYAKLTWDIDWDYAEGIREYCRLMFKDRADLMERYFELVEKASGLMQAFCEYGDNIDDLRNIPPQAPEFNKKHIDMINEAINLYKQAEGLIDKALEGADGELKERLVKEKHLISCTIPEAEAIFCQMTGRYLYFISGQRDKESLERWMDKAIDLRLKLVQHYNANVPGIYKGVNDFHGSYDMVQWNKAMKMNG